MFGARASHDAGVLFVLQRWVVLGGIREMNFWNADVRKQRWLLSFLVQEVVDARMESSKRDVVEKRMNSAVTGLRYTRAEEWSARRERRHERVRPMLRCLMSVVFCTQLYTVRPK